MARKAILAHQELSDHKVSLATTAHPVPLVQQGRKALQVLQVHRELTVKTAASAHRDLWVQRGSRVASEQPARRAHLGRRGLLAPMAKTASQGLLAQLVRLAQQASRFKDHWVRQALPALTVKMANRARLDQQARPARQVRLERSLFRSISPLLAPTSQTRLSTTLRQERILRTTDMHSHKIQPKRSTSRSALNTTAPEAGH